VNVWACPVAAGRVKNKHKEMSATTRVRKFSSKIDAAIGCRGKAIPLSADSAAVCVRQSPAELVQLPSHRQPGVPVLPTKASQLLKQDSLLSAKFSLECEIPQQAEVVAVQAGSCDRTRDEERLARMEVNSLRLYWLLFRVETRSREGSSCGAELCRFAGVTKQRRCAHPLLDLTDYGDHCAA